MKILKAYHESFQTLTISEPRYEPNVDNTDIFFLLSPSYTMRCIRTRLLGLIFKLEITKKVFNTSAITREIEHYVQAYIRNASIDVY